MLPRLRIEVEDDDGNATSPVRWSAAARGRSSYARIYSDKVKLRIMYSRSSNACIYV